MAMSTMTRNIPMTINTIIENDGDDDGEDANGAKNYDDDDDDDDDDDGHDPIG